MELGWIKELADDSNQREIEKQEKERRLQEEERMRAMQTIPFVEKLYKLIQTWCEEFNKHMMFGDLRINLSRLTKRSRAPYNEATPTGAIEEVAYFSFNRKQWMFGVRGTNGVVEFIEMPTTDGGSSFSMRLDELGLDSVYRLETRVDGDPMDMQKKNIVWTLKDGVMDGPKLGSLCQHFFSDFIKRTND